MQFKPLVIALATVVAAAPAPAPAFGVSHATVVSQWLYRGTTLTCSDDQNCDWQLSIDIGDGTIVPCGFHEAGSTADVPETKCTGSDFYVSLGWNSQGFWTMAVKDNANKLISYPAYNTNELKPNGGAAPDRSFNVEALA